MNLGEVVGRTQRNGREWKKCWIYHAKQQATPNQHGDGVGDELWLVKPLAQEVN